MKYEYKQIHFRTEINKISAERKDPNLSDWMIMDEILKKIGDEGWNILTANGDVILQRIKGE
jgi:hypothetical protein